MHSCRCSPDFGSVLITTDQVCLFSHWHHFGHLKSFSFPQGLLRNCDWTVYKHMWVKLNAHPKLLKLHLHWWSRRYLTVIMAEKCSLNVRGTKQADLSGLGSHNSFWMFVALFKRPNWCLMVKCISDVVTLTFGWVQCHQCESKHIGPYNYFIDGSTVLITPRESL